MKPIKFFILDSKTGDILERIVNYAAKDLKLNVQIKTSMQPYMDELPRDYEGYLLHLSNISEEAIENLKEKQPLSRVYGITGCGIRFVLPILDNTFYVVTSAHAKQMLEEILEINK